MSRPRWSKIFHDLWDHKARTLLVMLTIAVGVFAVGFVGDLFFITLPDLDRNYQVANPHAAIIYTDPFNDDLLPSLKRVPGVGEVEGRSGASARILGPGGDWLTFVLTGIPPVDQIQVSKLKPDVPGGVLPPLDEKEVYLDRSVRSVLQVSPGDFITIELADGTRRELRVAGFVFDALDQMSGFDAGFTLEAPNQLLPSLLGRQARDLLEAVALLHQEAIQLSLALLQAPLQLGGVPLPIRELFLSPRHFFHALGQGVQIVAPTLDRLFSPEGEPLEAPRGPIRKKGQHNGASSAKSGGRRRNGCKPGDVPGGLRQNGHGHGARNGAPSSRPGGGNRRRQGGARPQTSPRATERV